MANKQQNNKKTQKNPEVKKKKTKTKRQNSTVPSHALQYANMLANPDAGTIPQDGIYDGELGMFHRFVSTVTLNGTAGHTSGYLAFCPATGSGVYQSTAGSTVPYAVSFTTTGLPGAAFLSTNAFKTRAISCKIELIPSTASITNITGEAACGITTVGNFVGATTTADHLFDIAKAYGPLKREVVRSGWFPASLDHCYSVYNGPVTEDVNMTYIAYRGWPAGVPISFRISYVVEFTVKNTLGIPPTGRVSKPVGHHSVVSAMLDSDPHCFHSILDEFKVAGKGMAKDLGGFARGMLRNGLMKQAPKLLGFL